MLLNAQGEANGMVMQREMIIGMVSQSLINEFQNSIISMMIDDFFKRVGKDNAIEILNTFTKVYKDRYSNVDGEIKLTQVGQLLSQVSNLTERKEILGLAVNAFNDKITDIFFDK